MDEEAEIVSQASQIEKIRGFFINNKKSLISILIIIILSIFSFFFYKDYKKKKKIDLANRYNYVLIEFKFTSVTFHYNFIILQ